MSEEKLEILNIDPYLCPYEKDLQLRMQLFVDKRAKLVKKNQPLSDFANGYLYYGLHRTDTGWVYREYAPGVDGASLIGEFNNWDATVSRMKKLKNGNWEVTIKGEDSLIEGQHFKVRFYKNENFFDRIPAYSNRVVQRWDNGMFYGQVWVPKKPYKWTDGRFFKKHKIDKPLIYECHIGIATEEEKIGTYREFMENVLPRIAEDGYNCIQVMAVMEHPYYASFGYQVANFYAPSSRFGTPEELKDLINAAHKLKIGVFLDIVHSHSVRNVEDGLGEFDGTDYLYFHSGARGIHSAWDTRLFNYNKNEVLHFLLSNIKYWTEEFHFDGFRFDGVTSMLYQNHGLGESFDNYGKYFSMNTDTDAVTYLQLANELAHSLNPKCVTIAEDMSGMPGMCLPIEQGGIGFDYRLSMGVPDFWIKSMKMREEDVNLGTMWYELTTRRPMEKNIGYCESHDQALVGDKTIMFWLADQEMYWHMEKMDHSPVIARAMALHKMIRFITSSLAGEGYLNFMGNEFGHPEWIDFPRVGNNDSFQYARRQWSLVDNKNLKYDYLNKFDQAMLKILEDNDIYRKKPELMRHSEEERVLAYQRGSLVFLFNFHTWKKQVFDLDKLLARHGKAKKHVQVILYTEDEKFGGMRELEVLADHKLVLPARSAVVLK